MLTFLADESSGFPFAIVLSVFFIIVLLVILLIVSRFIGLYIQAFVSGARVNMRDLLGMRLRKVNALTIVNSRIQAMRAGLHVTTPESKPRARGRQCAPGHQADDRGDKRPNIDLSWQTATAIDLAGRDILVPCRRA